MTRVDSTDKPLKKGAKSRVEAKEETRRALIEAGIEAFREGGLDAPSLDAICARAGYTRGAFYVHFEDRDHFVVEVMEFVLRRFLDAVIAGGEGSPQGPDDLERAIELFVNLVEAGAFPVERGIPSHQFYAAAARSAAIRERYVQVVLSAVDRLTHAAHRAQDAQKIRSDVAPEHLATVLVALTLGIQHSVEVGIPFDVRKGADALLVMIRKSDG